MNEENAQTETLTDIEQVAPTVREVPPPVRKPRGFAAMDRDRVKAIASSGGKAAHVAGTAHVFTSDEARQAGRKGGNAPHVSRGTQARPKATEA